MKPSCMTKALFLVVFAACGDNRAMPDGAVRVDAALIDAAPAPPRAIVVAGDFTAGHPGVLSSLDVDNATIMMNGKAQYLAVKDKFPAGDPLFVLVSLKPNVAKIGVAGGSFADAKTIPLVKGKKSTLVNDATGARYDLRLVYTGAAPEQTESFTQAEK